MGGLHNRRCVPQRSSDVSLQSETYSSPNQRGDLDTMLVSAATNKPGNGKKKKPPLGLDTHMLNNKTAAAAGVGKRGLDTKARPRKLGVFDNLWGLRIAFC